MISELEVRVSSQTPECFEKQSTLLDLYEICQNFLFHLRNVLIISQNIVQNGGESDNQLCLLGKVEVRIDIYQIHLLLNPCEVRNRVNFPEIEGVIFSHSAIFLDAFDAQIEGTSSELFKTRTLPVEEENLIDLLKSTEPNTEFQSFVHSDI